MSTRDTCSATDGTRLALRRWDATGTPRASIVVIHGLGDHSGRFEHVGARLATAGFTVTAPDLRGHGESGGPRGHVDSFSRFFDDLDLVVRGLPDPQTPLVLMGHSLGGLVALGYVLDERIAPALLVLSAPALAADVPLAKKIAARLLGAVAPRLTIANGFDGGLLSRDPSIGEAYFADPLVLQRTTARLAKESLAAIARVRSLLDHLAVPTLVIHGGDDHLVPTTSSEQLGSLPGVERVVFPGFRHESFNEEGGREAVATVVSWLEGQLAAPARP